MGVLLGRSSDAYAAMSSSITTFLSSTLLSYIQINFHSQFFLPNFVILILKKISHHYSSTILLGYKHKWIGYATFYKFELFDKMKFYHVAQGQLDRFGCKN